MSEKPNTEQESRSHLILSGIASACFLLLFALIVWIAYLPTQPKPIGQDLRQVQEGKLRDLRSKATQELENYAVVNPVEKTVRIPIEKAMELTVDAYQR